MANENLDFMLQKSLSYRTSQARIASILLGVAIIISPNPARSDDDAHRVTTIGHWSIECDGKPTCIAVGVVPPRKNRMAAKQAALEIEFTHRRGLSHGLTLLKLDRPGPIQQIQLSPVQAELVLLQLVRETNFLILVPISANEVYYVPGLGFSALLQYVQRTIPEFQYSIPNPSPPYGPLK
jgi:hypothetical protein